MTEILINVYNFFGAILPFCFAIAIIGFILLLVSKSIDNFGSKTEKIIRNCFFCSNFYDWNFYD